jgi:uncharacterized protein (DUF1697 family)
MPELKRCFETVGFTDVKTVLSSGNVVFNARAAPDASLERTAEAAMNKQLGVAFLAIVRSLDALCAILASDPYGAFRLAHGAKRVATRLSQPVPRQTRDRSGQWPPIVPSEKRLEMAWHGD